MPAGVAPESPSAAILTGRGIMGPSGEHVEFPIGEAVLVLAVCRQVGARQLWIGHGARAALGLPATVEVPAGVLAWRHGFPHWWVDALRAAGWQPSAEPAGFAPWLELQRGGEHFDVVLPSWDGDNPFGAAETPRQQLDALGLFAGLLRHRYRRSPSATGLSLMRAAPRLDWPEAHLPPYEIRPRDPAGLWITPEPIGPEGWLHGFDLNGCYLAACSDVELGFGQPERVTEGSGPGYWRAAIAPAPGPSRPPLPFFADGRPHWYAPPALALAGELGATVHLLEGWRYPEHHRWLRPWYGRLRDARTQLLASPSPAAGLALDALKAVYTRTIGRLAGAWLEPGEQTFRPDWRDAVIARARANMYRHLAGVAARGGGWPVAMHADAVIYLAPEADPRAAAARLGLELSSQLGKWKVIGSAPARAATSSSRETPLRRARRLFEAELSA